MVWLNSYGSRYLFQRNENVCLHKNCTQIIIAALFVIAQNWKQSKCCSIGERLNWGKSISCISSKNEWTTDPQKLPGSQGHYGERKKAISKGYILYDSICKTFLRWQNYKNGKHINVCQRLGIVGWARSGMTIDG